MYPNLPLQISRLVVLRALQMQPHIYGGTALPQDPKRRAKRVKKLERNAARQQLKDNADAGL